MTQNNLGNAYSQLPTGDRAENVRRAIACYEEALRIQHLSSDTRATCHRNRAEAFVRLGHLDQARQDCEQAQALAPDHPYTYARIGQLAFGRGDYALAVQWLAKAIDRQQEADFYFERGLAYLAMGDQSQALADYQTALALADPIAVGEAIRDLQAFVSDRPEPAGTDAVRSLLAPQEGA
jgi:tetratricopeptide (TPR) repeat protein